MCDYPFFIPQVVLFANSSLFWFKVTNEHREFRNYLCAIIVSGKYQEILLIHLIFFSDLLYIYNTISGRNFLLTIG